MSVAISFTDIFTVLGITLFAGGTSFVGALIAKYVNFSTSIILFLTAFRAGILIKAKYHGVEPYYMDDSTPDGPVVF